MCACMCVVSECVCDVCCERVSVCVMCVVSECVRACVCMCGVCCERVSVCVHVCMCVYVWCVL